jgi:hypothetical protein
MRIIKEGITGGLIKGYIKEKRGSRNIERDRRSRHIQKRAGSSG